MNDFDTAEPTPADLAAIDAEWSQIQADLDLLANPDVIDALVDSLSVAELAAMTALDRRRLRRATAHTLRVVAELARTVTTPVASASLPEVA
ncbi:DUF6284 family protein [Actinoplanes philippinensis]|uniref:DUF6284 family protein n=1 Tax=Actinoplanes philippinensis TaxID=35752 RepID=UPI0033F062AF